MLKTTEIIITGFSFFRFAPPPHFTLAPPLISLTYDISYHVFNSSNFVRILSITKFKFINMFIDVESE